MGPSETRRSPILFVEAESEDVRFALELPGWSSADTGSSTSESPGVALSRATTSL
jgi:hypothetical protein